MAYAIVATRAPAERILALELAESCDGVTDQAILRACEAVSDEMQILVATCVPIEEPVGWAVIRCGQTHSAEPDLFDLEAEERISPTVEANDAA
jgi:hypothetical protein